MFTLNLKHIFKKNKISNTPTIRSNYKNSAIELINYSIDNKLLSNKSLECISTELNNITSDFSHNYISYKNEILYKLHYYNLSHKQYSNIISLINDLMAVDRKFKIQEERKS